jgi:Mg-chelatase subunit ChlD
LRNRNLWRLLLLIFAVLLLCGPSLIMSGKSLNLCVLVDRSRSISNEARSKQMEMLEYIQDNIKPGDKVSVVSFNDQPHVEQAPAPTLAREPLENPWSEDATDLAAGLETALGLLGDAPNSRVFLLSDGEYTARNPLGEARLARQQGTKIFYRDLGRLEVFNLSVVDVRMPEKTLVNEPFRIVFQVNSTSPTPGRYRLIRNDHILNEAQDQGWKSHQFQRGSNRIVFADAVPSPGIHGYRIEVESTPPDLEILRNDNSAEGFVQVIGERPVLLVNNTGQPDNVSNILKAGDIPQHILHIDNFRIDIRQLEGYKALILNNVPILNLTRGQIEDIRNFVTQEGGGLMVCGGNRGFASGGYYKTAIDDILPVSLEDRQQSKKTATAFSIVLDRSGSMAMTTPGGKTKMALANNASAECLRLMSSVDSVSVIAVDSAAHIIVGQQPVEDAERIVSDVLSIESMGGGIFTYTGLVAASSQVLGAKQNNKHILLFADAADAEEPGDYEALLEKLTKVGVTVSVVGLGSEKDVDAEFLKDVAKRGGGSVYFTDDAAQLVQFFTADTLTYTRNRFIEEPAPIVVGPASLTMAPQSRWKDFPCRDYNLLFARPDSNIALRTSDEDNAPILAFWQRGLGRVVSLALDPNLSFSETDQYPDIMLSAARWVMGSNVFDNLQINVAYEGNYASIRMELSEEEREKIGTPEMIIFTPTGKSIRKPMHWTSHDQLSASFKVGEPGLHRGIVRIGDQEHKIGPVSMPVSPEFLNRDDPEFGRRAMRELARVTGGERVRDLKQIFEREGLASTVRPIVLPLLIAFLVVSLLEIAEARFSMLHYMGLWWGRRRFRLHRKASAVAGDKRAEPVPQESGHRMKTDPSDRDQGESNGGTESTPSRPNAPAAEAKSDAALDYLKESKARAQRKMSK